MLKIHLNKKNDETLGPKVAYLNAISELMYPNIIFASDLLASELH